MSGMNKVILIGNIGNEPEVRQAGDNKKLILSIATSESWKNKEGKVQEETQWHQVVAWGKQAETLSKYTKKGDQIAVEGKLKHRTYEQDGVTKYATEVALSSFTFLKNSGQDSKQNEFDDDIPF